MIQYKLQNDRNGNACAVTIVGQAIAIPFDPANTDYQAYLKWLDGYEFINREWVKTAESNTPLPADGE